MVFPTHTAVYATFILSGGLYYETFSHWTSAFTTQMREIYIALIVQSLLMMFFTK